MYFHFEYTISVYISILSSVKSTVIVNIISLLYKYFLYCKTLKPEYKNPFSIKSFLVTYLFTLYFFHVAPFGLFSL